MISDISLPFGLRLHELEDNDKEFVKALFFSTRDYLYQIPLAKAQVDLLIEQQFVLQQASYQNDFPGAQTYIIYLVDEPVGKLIVNDTPNSLHIIDLALTTAMRGKGYCSALLRSLKFLADQSGRPVRLAVDQQNTRAKKFYLDLGFSSAGFSQTHELLLW